MFCFKKCQTVWLCQVHGFSHPLADQKAKCQEVEMKALRCCWAAGLGSTAGMCKGHPSFQGNGLFQQGLCVKSTEEMHKYNNSETQNIKFLIRRAVQEHKNVQADGVPGEVLSSSSLAALLNYSGLVGSGPQRMRDQSIVGV